MTSLSYRVSAASEFNFPGVSESDLIGDCDAHIDCLANPISEPIISGFAEGDHHESPNVPVTGTPLPPRDALQAAVHCVSEYLHTAGAAVLADLQLSGLAAPVAYSDTNTVVGYIDETVFESLIVEVLSAHEHVTRPLTHSDDQLINAVSAVHNMQFTQQTTFLDEDAIDLADWPAATGKQTRAPTGLVFTSPHPLRQLHNHPELPDRGIALVAGIQHLAIDSSIAQTDVALPYLVNYLAEHASAGYSAVEVVSSWYDVQPECVAFSLKDVQAQLSPGSLPEADLAHRYYLTDRVVNSLIYDSADERT